MVGYLFGPRLYRLFEWSQSQLNRKTGARDYELNTFELIGEKYINSVNYAVSFSCYCSPLIAYYGYQRGLLTNQGQLIYYMKVIAAIYAGLVTAYLIRGYGRMINPDYRKFLKDLLSARSDRNNRESLQLYDFEFHAWPVDFRWDESVIKSNVTYEDLSEKQSKFNIFSWPFRILQYSLAHGLARPMVFPGSVKLLQLAMSHAVLDGRSVLIEKNGLRSKLLTEDNNHIDTMFMDSRSDDISSEGNTLVICCEGNAAYYELGAMGTPMKAGYSVLGWNHPGFLVSTGLPNPDSERNAIDAVIRYAVTRLGFNLEDIILFSWSIGGFTASYAGMMYPNIKAVILDATFDNINQLALNKMPEFAGEIVKSVIKNYMNLDNVRHICKYPGRVTLIRRQRDELISLIPGDPSTNRGNYLLLNLLNNRYPHIFVKEACASVEEYLSADDAITQRAIIESRGGINKDVCESRLTIESDKPTFPMEIGKTWPLDVKIETALYLATAYMKQFDATHCMALPSTYFQLPWQHPVRE